MSGFVAAVSMSGLPLCVEVASIGFFQTISGHNRYNPFIHRIQVAKWEMASGSVTSQTGPLAEVAVQKDSGLFWTRMESPSSGWL